MPNGIGPDPVTATATAPAAKAHSMWRRNGDRRIDRRFTAMAASGAVSAASAALAGHRVDESVRADVIARNPALTVYRVDDGRWIPLALAPVVRSAH